MAHANFLITLRGGDFEGNWQHLAPGSLVEGSVQVVPESDIRANHVWVRLQWHTEGRGDRDEGRLAQLDVFQGVLTAQTPYNYSFSFTLPCEPWSYAGHYINIVWEVMVEVDVPMAPDIRHSQPFIMAPRSMVRAPGAA